MALKTEQEVAMQKFHQKGNRLTKFLRENMHKTDRWFSKRAIKPKKTGQKMEFLVR